MTERVDDCALEHSRDRAGSSRRVSVFSHWISLDSPGGQRLSLHRDGVIDEELNPHGRETHGGGTARAVGRRLVRQEELSAVNREAGNDMPTIQVPQDYRSEGGLVELNRCISVADSQHGRNLSPHGQSIRSLRLPGRNGVEVI